MGKKALAESNISSLDKLYVQLIVYHAEQTIRKQPTRFQEIVLRYYSKNFSHNSMCIYNCLNVPSWLSMRDLIPR